MPWAYPQTPSSSWPARSATSTSTVCGPSRSCSSIAKVGLNQGVAALVVLLVGAGVLGGVLLGGRTADRLAKRQLNARLNVAAVGFLVGAAALAVGLGLPWLGLSLPMFLLAAVAIGAPNPPLEQAQA